MALTFQSSSDEDEWVEKDSKKGSDVTPLKKSMNSNNEGSQVLYIHRIMRTSNCL